MGYCVRIESSDLPYDAESRIKAVAYGQDVSTRPTPRAVFGLTRPIAQKPTKDPGLSCRQRSADVIAIMGSIFGLALAIQVESFDLLYEFLLTLQEIASKPELCDITIRIPH
jgi:hypothetical protein